VSDVLKSFSEYLHGVLIDDNLRLGRRCVLKLPDDLLAVPLGLIGVPSLVVESAIDYALLKHS